jgi:putative ABC transport system permease protein
MFHKFLIQINIAFKTLRANLARTILSLLGITVGVAAVIIVLSLGLGTKDYVLGQIESFGTDLIEVEIKTPKTSQTSVQNASGMLGGAQVTTLKVGDLKEIAKLPNLGAWYGGVINQEIASYRDKNKRAMIFGVSSGIDEVDDQFEIERGLMYTEEDDKNLKQFVVMGSKVAEDFFGGSNPVGKSIRIKEQSYRVIGVLKERGSSGYFDFDNLLYIPVRTLQKKIMGIDHVQFGLFKIKDVDKTALTVAQMEDVMREQHDIDDPDDEDYAVMALSEAAEMLDQVFVAINVLLIAFASISLVVGGVGITNVMYVAVTERTSEIGLRKSLGARRGDILKQFLFEAIFITFAGGAIGIILGYILTLIGEFVVARLGFPLQFPVGGLSILIGAGFSIVIGIVFGIRPAVKASRLSPMEALRKE